MEAAMPPRTNTLSTKIHTCCTIPQTSEELHSHHLPSKVPNTHRTVCPFTIFLSFCNDLIKVILDASELLTAGYIENAWKRRKEERKVKTSLFRQLRPSYIYHYVQTRSSTTFKSVFSSLQQ
ncbi:hypothetical protein, unlikely [Trypanosoma brucei gambiense DAL972]|uniref:Uncharacterized protein n=1 Tax=Trypanosoma brucei gambiense (strain MHOM/CI/86/DAL972) TaxID=679716 RepID=D0A9J7_TRYB9|nr:hypothetical protein, unlikely [Trypanosoma brucei gambiense DAL972]CBH18348.1 hypothetical protein, unlikely [Trypanosoma brucei gambiense DAL972]|eukprot:XP_011780612.1 hypothetical protein, unlikely [Trypanosoma brucei gambiense DAL972]